MKEISKIINKKIILSKIIFLFIIINCYFINFKVYAQEINSINNRFMSVENADLFNNYKKVTPKYLIREHENEVLNSEEKVIISRKNKPSKIVFLTFDDGPSKNTTKVLDILKENNVRATFFVNGKSEYKDVYERMYKEGHCIGNHTYSHEYNLIYSSVDDFKYDVKKLSVYLTSLGIKDTKVIRFPGGSNNTVSHKYGGNTIMNELTSEILNEGYKYYDWDVDSGDATARTVTKQIIVNNIRRECKSRTSAIILMHDSSTKKTTVEALPEIIAYLKSQNYEFNVLTSEDSPVVRFQ